MATTEEIASLRIFMADADGETYTDEVLAAVIDSSGGVKSAASDLWVARAASYASLVNVSESGSSRSLGDLHQNALRMAKEFSDDASEATVESTGIRIRRLSRP